MFCGVAVFLFLSVQSGVFGSRDPANEITIKCDGPYVDRTLSFDKTLPLSKLFGGGPKGTQTEMDIRYNGQSLNDSLTLEQLEVPDGAHLSCQFKGAHKLTIEKCGTDDMKSNPKAQLVEVYHKSIETETVYIIVTPEKLLIEHTGLTSSSGNPYSTGSDGNLPDKFKGKIDQLAACVVETTRQIFIYLP